MQPAKTYHSTLSRSIAPWFVVAWENTEMAPTNKLFIIKAQNRVVAIQEIGMEDDLDTIVTMVEEFDPTNLVEDGVVSVIGHIVRHDGWERIPFERKDPALEKDLIFFREQLVR